MTGFKDHWRKVVPVSLIGMCVCAFYSHACAYTHVHRIYLFSQRTLWKYECLLLQAAAQ